MAEQKDSGNPEFHLYKNNGHDNPDCSYKREKDFVNNKAHKARESL